MSPPQVIMATHARLVEKGTMDPSSKFRFAGILMTHWPETTNCIQGHLLPGRKVSCNTELLRESYQGVVGYGPPNLIPWGQVQHPPHHLKHYAAEVADQRESPVRLAAFQPARPDSGFWLHKELKKMSVRQVQVCLELPIFIFMLSRPSFSFQLTESLRRGLNLEYKEI